MKNTESTKKQFVEPTLTVYGDVRRITATVALTKNDNTGGGAKS